MDELAEMVSFGGGVNTIAMVTMLVEQGWHGSIVFADTGGENPKTYCYMDYYERKFLRPHKLWIERLSPATHPELYDDKRLGGLANTLEDYCLKRGIIPLLAVRWCSVQFKRNPLENWRTSHNLSRTLMGICTDEPGRVHWDDPTVGYPLVDAGINRKECMRIIQRAGLELPVKSGCFFCPGQSLGQWRTLYHEYPDLYERAARLEENASAHCQKWATLDPKGISVREKARRRWEGEEPMDLSRWLPCACTL